MKLNLTVKIQYKVLLLLILVLNMTERFKKNIEGVIKLFYSVAVILSIIIGNFKTYIVEYNNSFFLLLLLYPYLYP